MCEVLTSCRLPFLLSPCLCLCLAVGPGTGVGVAHCKARLRHRVFGSKPIGVCSQLRRPRLDAGSHPGKRSGQGAGASTGSNAGSGSAAPAARLQLRPIGQHAALPGAGCGSRPPCYLPLAKPPRRAETRLPGFGVRRCEVRRTFKLRGRPIRRTVAAALWKQRRLQRWQRFERWNGL